MSGGLAVSATRAGQGERPYINGPQYTNQVRLPPVRDAPDRRDRSSQSQCAAWVHAANCQHDSAWLLPLYVPRKSRHAGTHALVSGLIRALPRNMSALKPATTGPPPPVIRALCHLRNLKPSSSPLPADLRLPRHAAGLGDQRALQRACSARSGPPAQPHHAVRRRDESDTHRERLGRPGCGVWGITIKR